LTDEVRPDLVMHIDSHGPPAVRRVRLDGGHAEFRRDACHRLCDNPQRRDRASERDPPGQNAGNGQTARKLVCYTYSISGVTYETAQDVTGLEERIHLERVVAGQLASVKYDPSNPSNSILVADDWSGLH